MKAIFENPFKGMKIQEYIILGVSLTAIIVSFILIKEKDYLTFITAINGMFMAIFVARAHIFAQIFGIINVILYGITSYITHYYGELIISVALYFPLTIIATVSWIKHLYKQTPEVEIEKINYKDIIYMILITTVVTVGIFFLLRALNTPNLIVSVLSVSISTAAAYLSIRRSPFYALAYSFNDIVIIVLWGLATKESMQYLPLTISFIGFFLCDSYGLINWLQIRRRQKRESLQSE